MLYFKNLLKGCLTLALFSIWVTSSGQSYQSRYGSLEANSTRNTTAIKKMQWVFDGYRFTIQLPLHYNTYLYYKGFNKKRSAQHFSTEYITKPYLLDVAKELDKDAQQLGYTGYKMVEYLVAFVQQNIIYTTDPYNDGWDYPKFPIETLYEKKGDCEDSAILLATLLKVFGFDAKLVNLPGHMAVAFACKNCDSYYPFNGKEYAYIETTKPKWKIGQMPDEYTKTNATLEDVLYAPLYERSQTKKPSTIWEEKAFVGQSQCSCANQKVKNIKIAGKFYMVRPNESYSIFINGVKVTLSNNN